MNLIKNIFLIFIVSLCINLNAYLHSADDDEELIVPVAPAQAAAGQNTTGQAGAEQINPAQTNTSTQNTPAQPQNATEQLLPEQEGDIATDAIAQASGENVATNGQPAQQTPAEPFVPTPVLNPDGTPQLNPDGTPVLTQPPVNTASNVPQAPAPSLAEINRKKAEDKTREKEQLDSFLKSYNFLNDLNLDKEDTFVLPGDAEKYIVLETPYKLIIIELYTDEAPKTIALLKKLIREKFYDNTTFFRLIPNYIIQGGDPSDTGYGGYGRPRPAEISQSLKFERGTIAMSNLGDLQSDDSQFFITFNNSPWLDGKYTIFGKVISGINYLEKLTGRYDNDGFLEAPVLVVRAYVYSDYLAQQEEAKQKLKKEAEDKLAEEQRKKQEEAKQKREEQRKAAANNNKMTKATLGENKVDPTAKDAAAGTGNPNANPTTATKPNPTATGGANTTATATPSTRTGTGTTTGGTTTSTANNTTIPR